MIAGTIILEDRQIVFTLFPENQAVTYTVADGLSGRQATLTVPAPAFLAALGIALHNDCEPNWERDYPAAESVQPFFGLPTNGEEEAHTIRRALRWIP